MSTNYTAITIGPIYDTMELTSSPGGLWGASCLFSWIARALIQSLVALGVPEEEFVAPCFCLDREQQVTLAFPEADGVCERMRNQGVGMLHDRIIFRSQTVPKPLELVRQARTLVIQKLAQELGGDSEKNKRWLESYLRIYALSMDVPEQQSPLIYLGKYLSAMELEPQFHGEEAENLLLRLFENVAAGKGDTGQRSDYRNALLKDSFLRKDLTGRWLLFGRGEKIRDLESIASLEEKVVKKHQQYYVVLKSDGDSMGAMLAKLTDKDAIRAYSRQCLIFCARAAEQIMRYGGMPLYAGGDDLLALLPAAGWNPETGSPCTVFALAESLRTLFNTSFAEARKEHDGKPTISFGLSVQFYKSPLYEALKKADEMLWTAKSGKKNACCIHLQKHSGQSVCFCEEQMDRYEGTGQQNLYAALDALLEKTQNEKPEEAVNFLSRAGYQIELFRALFHRAILLPEERKTIVHNLFANLFDNADQKNFKSYLEELEKLTVQIFDHADRLNGEDEAQFLNRTMGQVHAAVRLLHFMREKKEAEA